MAKSYFAILGVSTDASNKEIHSAYRRLAKALHPDRYDGGSHPFRQVQEAYAVLGDPEKRRAYEESLAGPEILVRRARRTPLRPQPEPLIPGAEPVDLGVMTPIGSFESIAPAPGEILDWLEGNSSSLPQRKSGGLQHLTLEITLTREQARRGGTARVMVPVRAPCPTCQGRGGVWPYECGHCGGQGGVSGEMPVSISFPPGICRDYAVGIALKRFGIRNLQLTVLFRPRDTHHI